jgi:hypothetical protein
MSTANDNADVSPLFVQPPRHQQARCGGRGALVALLDHIDGEADLEEDNPPEEDAPAEDVGDNEPSLGSVGSTSLLGSYSQIGWAQGADDDREVEDEHDESGGDDEPMLDATAAINHAHA